MLVLAVPGQPVGDALVGGVAEVKEGPGGVGVGELTSDCLVHALSWGRGVRRGHLRPRGPRGRTSTTRALRGHLPTHPDGTSQGHGPRSTPDIESRWRVVVGHGGWLWTWTLVFGARKVDGHVHPVSTPRTDTARLLVQEPGVDTTRLLGRDVEGRGKGANSVPPYDGDSAVNTYTKGLASFTNLSRSTTSLYATSAPSRRTRDFPTSQMDC